MTAFSKALGALFVLLLATGAVPPANAGSAQAESVPTESAHAESAHAESAHRESPPDAGPTLEQQNDAGDHELGGTLAENEPQVSSLKAQAVPGEQAASIPVHVLGMDVSGWQPDVDWNTAWSNGARFVYIKTTESNDYASSHFSKQWSGATAVGMVRGAYHFANPHESTGAVQANYFVDHGGGWSADGRTLPPMLDIEYDPYTGSDGTNSCYGLSQASMAAWISEFSNTVMARTGVWPTVYSTTNWWKLCTGNNGSFGANPLFIARWPNSLSDGTGPLPAGWGDYTFWQYASAGTFPGDQDLFNGDYSKLRSFASNGRPPTDTDSLDGNFIESLYNDFLGRAPAPADINFWEGLLATGSPRSIIANGFVTSDEYRLIRIDAAYRGILGRGAEPSGRQNWLRAMQDGVISTDDIETTLYASEEYFQQHGSTNAGFASSLYSALLHRDGAAADLDFWARLSSRYGRSWVIDRFWDSEETVSERVAAMYQRYLGRSPDSGGLQNWVGIALAVGDSGLRVGLTSSEEYFARAQR